MKLFCILVLSLMIILFLETRGPVMWEESYYHAGTQLLKTFHTNIVSRTIKFRNKVKKTNRNLGGKERKERVNKESFYEKELSHTLC